MNELDDEVVRLLETSAERWRAADPELTDLDIAGLVRRRNQRRTFGLPGAAFATLAIVLAAVLVTIVFAATSAPAYPPAASSSPPSPTPTAAAAAECFRGEYRAIPTPDHQVTPDDLSTIRTIIENRIHNLGVAGAIVQTQGSDRIVVQLPCIANEQDVRDAIGSTGRLDFVPIPLTMTGVEQGTSLGTSLPACPDNLAGLANPCVLFSGDQIASVSSSVGSTGQSALDFTLKSEGATLFDKFAAVAYAGIDSTGNEQFAIVLDGTVVSAPTVNAPRFDGQGQISGASTPAELNNLVTILKYGALPLAIEEVSFTGDGSTSPSPECPNQTWPPYEAPNPIAGISIVVRDKGHFEITNATSATYYYEIGRWPTAQLVCGLGRIEQGMQSGPVGAGKTVQIGEGSTADVPITVKIWDAPCGDGCDRPPIGSYLVPVSTIEPVPVST